MNLDFIKKTLMINKETRKQFICAYWLIENNDGIKTRIKVFVIPQAENTEKAWEFAEKEIREDLKKAITVAPITSIPGAYKDFMEFI